MKIRKAISTVVEDIQSIRKQLKPLLVNDNQPELLNQIIFGLEALEQMIYLEEPVYQKDKDTSYIAPG